MALCAAVVAVGMCLMVVARFAKMGLRVREGYILPDSDLHFLKGRLFRKGMD